MRVGLYIIENPCHENILSEYWCVMFIDGYCTIIYYSNSKILIDDFYCRVYNFYCMLAINILRGAGLINLPVVGVYIYINILYVFVCGPAKIEFEIS